MNITLLGSLGNVSKPLAQQLLAAGHHVTIVSSDANKKNAIEQLGAKAAIGSVNDKAFLEQAFTGADAVYAMTPPSLGGSNIKNNTIAAGKTIATAVAGAGVKQVVMLSSIGADKPEGTGPIASLYHIENAYRALEDVAVVFLRAGFFYLNFYGNVDMIKHMGIIGANYPGDIVMPLVHPEDIATAAAEALQEPLTGQQVRYVISDVRTPHEVATVFGQAINQPTLAWVEFTDEQSLQGMQQAGLPAEVADLYTEMGAGFRKGIITEDFVKSGSPVSGSIKLEAFAADFAKAF